MAYFAAPTEIPGGGFRPWEARLGDYQRAAFCIPTASRTSSPLLPDARVTGGLGAGIDFTSVPVWLWIAGAAAVWFAFLNPPKRRRRRAAQVAG